VPGGGGLGVPGASDEDSEISDVTGAAGQVTVTW
jgi:hypothetical protein